MKRKFLVLLVCLISAVSMAFSFAGCDQVTFLSNIDGEEPEGDQNLPEKDHSGLEYRLNADGVSYTVIGIGTASGSVIVPATFNEKTVTAIGDEAFVGCSTLTGITVSDGVTSIGQRAFYDCENLTAITLPDSIAWLGWNAFYNTGYYNNNSNWKDEVLYIGRHLVQAKDTVSDGYEIKDGTLTIGDDSFYGLTDLSMITIPEGVRTIGNEAFSGSGLAGSLLLPDSVTAIGYEAFDGCKWLTDFTIPSKLTCIKSFAFNNCTGLTMTSFTAPSGMTMIEGNVFINTGITSIELAEGNERLYIEGNCVVDKKSKTALAGFGDNVTIPDDVTAIGDYAFYYCDGLTGELRLPDGLKTIGNAAFYGCNGLTGELTLPDTVTAIEDQAFGCCGGLTITSFTIPANVTFIGGDILFANEVGNIEVAAGNQAFRVEGNCVIEKASMTVIMAYGDDIDIPDGVLAIGNSAFFGYSCQKKELRIPDSVKTIGDFAFFNCNYIKSIVLGSGVETIGLSAFDTCFGLASVTIGSNVTSIGAYALRGCKKLENIYYGGTQAQWDAVKKGADWDDQVGVNGSTGAYALHYDA